jgi:tRNA C32,U32 (ribose-2'-O)-methylase TrmJ
LLAAQARAQTDQAIAAHQAQIAQQKAQNDAIHLQVKAQAEIEFARIKADLDAKLALFDAHLTAATETQRQRHSPVQSARKAREGHHYVADPKRPRKFMMVVHHA